MTKVEHTKTHQIVKRPWDGKKVIEVLVTDAKLVLVDCKPKDGLIYIPDWKHEEGNLRLLTKDVSLTDAVYKAFKPILISETEKTEVGDWAYSPNCRDYDKSHGVIFQVPKDWCEDGVHYQGEVWLNKILALPEHFSSQQLQMIVDGKLKDGSIVLLECEDICLNNIPLADHTCTHKGTKIKLNPHITIYPVENLVYDQLSKLHDWICEQMSSISQEEIDKDFFQLGRFRTYKKVIEKIKSYPVGEKVLNLNDIEFLLKDAFGAGMDYQIGIYENGIYGSNKPNFEEWFAKQNVK